jgi:hypothetical protein
MELVTERGVLAARVKPKFNAAVEGVVAVAWVQVCRALERRNEGRRSERRAHAQRERDDGESKTL